MNGAENHLNLIRLRLGSVDNALDQIRLILLYQAGLLDGAEFKEKFDRAQDKGKTIGDEREEFLEWCKTNGDRINEDSE